MHNLLIVPLLSFGLAVVLAQIMIPYFRRLKIGQSIRDDGPARHLQKAGTPTMGGLLFITSVVISLIVLQLTGMGGLDFWSTLAFLLLFVGYGLLGFVDDYIKVVKKRPLGLKAREKLIIQFLLSLIVIYISVEVLKLGTYTSIPFTSSGIEWGLFYPLFALVVIIGTANAVNLTDGLDGLAGGISVSVYVFYIFLAVTLGELGLALAAAAVVGGVLAFLIYNMYPARIIMGDTGAMALGGGIAALAILTKTELFLPVIGGIFVIETLSVIIQVISFRLTGKRVFKMSPLHHHFELNGLRETQVVQRFWLASGFFVVLGFLALFYTGR